jgi:cysteine-rich repeat protein
MKARPVKALYAAGMRVSLLASVLVLSACGARSDLGADAESEGAGGAPGAGGSPSVTVGQGGSPNVTVGEGGGGVVSVTTTVGAGGAPPGQCGDAIVDPGEACDAGSLNEDRPALAYRQAGGAWTPLRPREQGETAVDFYDYFSASSHTGLEAVRTSRLFFFRNTLNGVTSLVVHHGIDQGTSGVTQPNAKVQMLFAGLPMGTFVGISDDGMELSQVGGIASAKWKFDKNSDGGVLAGLPLPGDWLVTVDATFEQGVDTWEIVEDGASVPGAGLDPDQTLELRATSTPSPCRTDCSLPTCGDGLLDAGEACDDGNLVSGDGCRGDCAATQ